VWAGLFIRLQNGTETSSFVFGYDELFVTIALFVVRVCGLPEAFVLATDLTFRLTRRPTLA
jgi:hypothetical protein